MWKATVFTLPGMGIAPGMRRLHEVAPSMNSSGDITRHDASFGSGAAPGPTAPADDLERWLEAHRRLDERMREAHGHTHALDGEHRDASGGVPASAADDEAAASDDPPDRSHFA